MWVRNSNNVTSQGIRAVRDIDIDSEGDSNMYPANTSDPAINDEPSSSMTAPGPTMGDGSSALPTSFSKEMFQASFLY